ncbi:MAG TPA: helix-turn-helix transcriptional regulator [Burkholderiaceae bacterium]|jgi:transcriptional regulator EpsA
MDRDKLLLDVLNACTEVLTPNDFMTMISGPVARLMPYEIMICGIGGTGPDGNYVHKFLNRDYPLEYYYALQQSNGKVNSPLIQLWRQTQQPVIYQSGRDDHQFPQDWVALFNKYDLRNSVGHGVLDLSGPFSSYFIFSRLPVEAGQNEIAILNLITPHLHHALARISPLIPVFDFHSESPQKQLTARQLEILSWINEGKSNWEIAAIINTTKANVKYHVDQIFQKLGVSTRIQAVACAKEIGLLPPSRSSRS